MTSRAPGAVAPDTTLASGGNAAPASMQQPAHQRSQFMTLQGGRRTCGAGIVG
jgi:hypothetical protein